MDHPGYSYQNPLPPYSKPPFPNKSPPGLTENVSTFSYPYQTHTQSEHPQLQTVGYTEDEKNIPMPYNEPHSQPFPSTNINGTSAPIPYQMNPLTQPLYAMPSTQNDTILPTNNNFSPEMYNNTTLPPTYTPVIDSHPQPTFSPHNNWSNLQQHHNTPPLNPSSMQTNKLVPPVLHQMLQPSKTPAAEELTYQTLAHSHSTQPYSANQGTYYRQKSADRIPNTLLTNEEWNSLNCPVSLLYDSNFLPSDNPEIPPKPPLSTLVNCDPRFMRCTLSTIPSTSKLQSKCSLPLGLIVHPFRDVTDLPIIQTPVIVRCRSCRTYVNPFVKFLDNGRRWRCPICSLANSVPDEFFYDPASQSYGDPLRRPEIRSATVEFIAPSEYMLRPPQAATYVFCLEVNRNAVSTGYLDFLCPFLATQLTKLPGGARRQIVLLTYDSGIHFYILSDSKMRMVICRDLSEVFLPDVDGMINRIDDNMDTLTNLLQQIPSEFSTTQDTGNCLGFVLQTALKLISNSGGRITVFNTSLPSIGPGALEDRQDKADLDKPDLKHLGPATDFYKSLALDFAAVQISVDLFLLNSNYCDIATLSGVARHSGGDVYHYPDYHYSVKTYSDAPTVSTALNDASQSNEPSLRKVDESVSNNCDFVQVESFSRDLLRYLTRKIGFEAVLRIRCTRGLNIRNFYGSFFVRSVDLLSLPTVNPDAGYGMQLEITDSLQDLSVVICQAALLYTSAYGDRRIRVHTLCLPVTDSLEAIYNYCDQSAIACLVTKMAVERSIMSGISNAREALTTVVGDIISAYQKTRNKHTTAKVASHLCPASLRLLPAYICGALRHPAFRLHLSTRLDDRSAAFELLINASCSYLLTLIYPRLFAIHPFITSPSVGAKCTLIQKAAALSLKDDQNNVAENVDEEVISNQSFPGCLSLTASSISREGVYLLDTGSLLLLLVGYGIPSNDLYALMGLHSYEDIQLDKTALHLPSLGEGETVPISRLRLQRLINYLRRERCLGTTLVLLRHTAPNFLKLKFVAALVEDSTESAASYPEFVQMILNTCQS